MKPFREYLKLTTCYAEDTMVLIKLVNNYFKVLLILSPQYDFALNIVLLLIKHTIFMI